MLRLVPRLVCASLGALLLAGCEGKATAPDGPQPQGDTPTPAAPRYPFEAVTAYRAAEKVKYVASGAPLTAAELQQVRADPQALGPLVDAWLASPEGQAKLLAFFTDAFQQKVAGLADFDDQLGNAGLGNVDPRLVDNLRESFPRTALQLVNEGRPFTEVVTTRSFMVTPALASFLALLDSRHVNDKLQVKDRLVGTYKVQTAVQVPLADTVNPASPLFLVFNAPSIPTCPTSATDPTPRTERVFTRNLSADLFSLLMGRVQDDPNRTGLADTECRAFTGVKLFEDADFLTWRKVTVRRPAAGEATTQVYDLPRLRSSSELVLSVPRVGFFSTPAFFANWATNDSNQARVTANQALIVALNHSIEGSDTTVPLSEPALDAEHADPSTVCYSCHKTLDPMRQVFRRNYTFGYHEQLDAAPQQTDSVFSFAGVSVKTNEVADYAATVASHPAFAEAWTQKLCSYVNSAPCVADDPEFQRVALAFEASRYDFRVLLRELLTSPLVTGFASTKTRTDQGEPVSVARKDHLCTALATRLKLANPCGLSAQASRISATFPLDGYSRGSEVPLTIRDTSLFYRAGTENLCAQVAARAVDATGGPYSSTSASSRAAGLADMVHALMGLPDGDPRAAAALQILTEHYDAAVKGGARATDALRSTFVLACQSPSVTAVGL
ncbi:DUF1800 domain-containing protein [Aggregicoccus sp. 17bor-14]|uniref:hypothetical protein n=1 Tax=Myxococcaceae TaxID=31 RepID=UPI00129C3E68|nr:MULTISPECIES: hypothetical protein [Myxococcaceae]MBF5043534.1 hypothetical protein [Simulacricoccus sp. 17bor-14]MRI89291.1 DUF1800 domain-containing protein [Aggregicoccus sp. 17bor-14]